MNKVLCFIPFELIVLPKLEYDDEGNLRNFSCVGYTLNEGIVTEVKKTNSDNFKINYENDKLLEFINKIKNENNFDFVEIKIENKIEIGSLNFFNTLFLSCSFPYFWLFNNKNLNNITKFIDKFLIKNKLGFEISNLILNGGFSLFLKYNDFYLINRIPIDLKKYKILLIEIEKYNILEFLEDKNYRNVVSFHVSEAFNSFLNSLSLEKLYEENYYSAFQSGLFDEELLEIRKILLNLNVKYIGYNFFSKGLHCLILKDKIYKIKDIIEKNIDKKNIFIFDINYEGILLKNFD